MTQKSFSHLERTLEKLKAKWPKPVSKEVAHIFEEAHTTLKEIKRSVANRKPSSKKNEFDFVQIVNQLLKTHDLLFLSRQLTYHVVTTADLPKAFGSENEALSILTELFSITTKRSNFGSRLQIEIRTAQLRAGSGIEVKLICEVKSLSENDRQQLLEQFYGKNADKKAEASGIAYAKESLRKVGGQLWFQFTDETHIAMTFNWPAFDFSKVKPASPVAAYKLDICITDYIKIRQRFGIVRGKKLIGMVENFVKSMVRYPIDMVIAFPTQGMITAIYESQDGSASSVSNRISQRLKKEAFRVGQVNVTPKFRYQLSTLN
ncbi:MAG: hypothetical protein Q7T03_06365 [Deltaproteobacteria bacterium]|nr:hypothetical protein [Deltaproteobacteria bacterium]